MGAALFVEPEALEERQVPIVPTRAAYRVVTEIAPFPDCRRSEHRWIDVLDLLVSGHDVVLVCDLAGQVRSIVRVRYAVVALLTAQVQIDRNARLRNHDSRNLPATDGRLHKSAGIVTEQGNVIDEVESRIVRAVETAGTDVVLPSQVRIRSLRQVCTARTT